MRTATPAFRAAVARSDTEPVSTVIMTWPSPVSGAPTDLSAMFVSIAPAADYTTDTPAGTRLIAGYPARSASLALGGMVKDPAHSMQQLFDPYSPNSPLYRIDWTGISGARIVYAQGLRLPGVASPETFVIMTGYVDNCSIDRSTGEVTLSLLDYRPLLSAVPTLPMMLSRTLYYGSMPGLSSLTFIEQILAANGIYAAPPPRTGEHCTFYAGLHGTLWPLIGAPVTDNLWANAGSFPSTAQQFEPAWVPGKFAGAVPQAFSLLTQTPSAPAALSLGSTFLFEGWVQTVAQSAALAANDLFRFGVSDMANLNSPDPDGDNAAFIKIQQNSTGGLRVTAQISRAGSVSGVVTTYAGSPGWHQVMVQFTITGALTATADIWIDGVHNAASGSFPIVAFAANPTFVWAESHSMLAADSWQITTGVTSPTPTVFTPTAVLDASLNYLTATPDIGQTTDAWGVLQSIADAEFATCGFDEDLIFRFTNRYDYPDTPGAVITSLTQIKDLVFETNEANRARAVTATVAPLTLQPRQVVWNASDTYAVPAHGSLTIFAQLNGVTAFVPFAASFLPAGTDPASITNNSYRANSKPDGSGSICTLAFTTVQLGSQTALITLTNPNSFIAYLVTGAGYPSPKGSPALWLIGEPVNAGPVLIAQNASTVTVTATYGSGLPALPLPDTVWRQDQAAVQLLCNDVLADYVVPLPQLTAFDIVGDATLQLGDRVQISDSGVLATFGAPTLGRAVMADDLFLTSIHPTASPDGGFVQQITGRMNNRPGQWVLGVPGRSELGSTTWA